jgi:hypothetical protein
MVLTQADVLGLFDQVAAIKNSDQILLITANQNGTVSATKITAELLRAYLNAGFSLTIDSDGYICIGGVRTTTMAGSTQIIHQTDTVLTIQPNVLNLWGTVSGLTIDFATGAEGSVNEYMIQFTSPAGAGATLALPNSVKWVNDEPLEPEAGMTYQVSIVNNLAVYAGWEADSV